IATPRGNAAAVVRALIQLITPVIETRLVRLTAEQIEVLLTNKVFRRFERIGRIAIRQSSESCLGPVAYLSKRSAGRAESVVGPHRNHGVEAVSFYAVEAIPSVCVGDELATLRAA